MKRAACGPTPAAATGSSRAWTRAGAPASLASRVSPSRILTVKYSPAGVRKWLKTWSGGGPDDDEPNGMVLGTKGGVYVGGQPTGKGDISQAALLKYQR